MPAKQSAGGVNPVEKSAKSSSPTPKNWFSDRLLIPTVAIFLLVILFFIGFSAKDKINLDNIFQRQKTVGKQSKAGSFDRIVESSKKAAEETKSYQAYLTLFGTQRQQYYSDGQASHREQAEKTRGEAKSLFASEFKDYEFALPCIDDGCKVLPLVPAVKNIAQNVDSEQGVNEDLNRLTSASIRVFSYYSQDTPVSVIYQSYDQLFHNLVSIYQINKGEKIKADIEQVLALMKETKQDQFEYFSKLGFYKY